VKAAQMASHIAELYVEEQLKANQMAGTRRVVAALRQRRETNDSAHKASEWRSSTFILLIMPCLCCSI
jgi:hypothetical protein